MGNLFRPTEYMIPNTLEEAISILKDRGKDAKIMAGCTDVFVDKPPGTKTLVDISNLNLNYITRTEDGIRIGATTTYASLQDSELLRVHGLKHILLQAVDSVGHPMVRNMGTIGGNICSAVSCADIPPALMALDASLVIVGPTEEKTVSVNDFLVDNKKTILNYDEILKEIRVPDLPADSGGSFLKLARTSVDLAQVNVAACVTLGEEGLCKEARIALGAVAPTPIRAKGAEAFLRGKKLDDSVIEQAASIASQETKPISDIRASAAYRKEMTKTLVRRALNQAVLSLIG